MSLRAAPTTAVPSSCPPTSASHGLSRWVRATSLEGVSFRRYPRWVKERSESIAGDLVEGLAGLLPGGSLAGVGLKRLTETVVAEHKRNRSRALHAAEVMSGLSREEVAEKIADNPRLVPLLTRVLYVSAMTGQDEVLIGLGAALGAAVSDDDKIDEAEFMLARIEELRRHHFQILHIFAGRSPWDTHRVDETGARIDFWREDEILTKVSMRQDLVEVALTGLHASGLLQLERRAEGNLWTLSPFGRDVLDLVAAVSAD